MKDGGTITMETNIFNNISYKSFLSTGLANYISTSTANNTKTIQYWVHYEDVFKPTTIMKYSYIDIAYWFLKKSSLNITKLQMLCYYAQAWGYATKNYLVSNTIFYATSNGPASKDIAQYFGNLNQELLQNNHNSSQMFDIETIELLESVWLTYGHLASNALVSLSESELPWIQAYGKNPSNNEEINVETMKEFYKSISSK